MFKFHLEGNNFAWTAMIYIFRTFCRKYLFSHIQKPHIKTPKNPERGEKKQQVKERE